MRKKKIVVALCQYVFAELALWNLAAPKMTVRRRDLIFPGSGTPWDQVWRAKSNEGMISYVGFHLDGFLMIHEAFVVELTAMGKPFLNQGHFAGRRPQCDSQTLLAVGLFYCVNMCHQKVC